MDGASAWRSFWRVVVPLMSPTIFFAAVIGGDRSRCRASARSTSSSATGRSSTRTRTCSSTTSTTTIFYNRNFSTAACLSIALFLITLARHRRAVPDPRAAGALWALTSTRRRRVGRRRHGAPARRARARDGRRSRRDAVWTYVALCVGVADRPVPDLRARRRLAAARPTSSSPTRRCSSRRTRSSRTTARRCRPSTWASTCATRSIQTGIIVVAQVVTSVLAAYAFVFLRFPLRRTLFLVVLGDGHDPLRDHRRGQLHDGRATSAGRATSSGSPSRSSPRASGSSSCARRSCRSRRSSRRPPSSTATGRCAFLWRIAIPLARPVIAALAVFSFLGAWNQYLWPALLTNNNQSIRTVQIGLASDRREQRDGGRSSSPAR